MDFTVFFFFFNWVLLFSHLFLWKVSCHNLVDVELRYRGRKGKRMSLGCKNLSSWLSLHHTNALIFPCMSSSPTLLFLTPLQLHLSNEKCWQYFTTHSHISVLQTPLEAVFWTIFYRATNLAGLCFVLVHFKLLQVYFPAVICSDGPKLSKSCL